MQNTRTKEKSVFGALKDSFGYKNPMQAPRLVKAVVSTGVGSIKDPKKITEIAKRLIKITGQAPSVRPAKKSIAGFKMRAGDIMGYQVTLRGERMFSFIDKLIHIALPRTKDFRGISRGAIDDMGNITISIREHTVFPETADEDLKDVFGFAVTLVTTARSKEEAEALFTHLGIPFKNDQTER